MFARFITEKALRQAAGPRSFERGLDYFESGAVTDLIDTGAQIKARVLGSEEYAVRLWIEDEALGHDCTCPVGDEGEFCKHAVAAGLAWLARGTHATAGQGRGDKDIVQVREWLERAPRETLVELLMEQIEDDSGLRHRLHARAARASDRVDLKELKETVDKALRVQDFVDYQGMRRLLDRARSVLELLSGLREDGHAGAAWELAHHALKRALVAYERSDDSGGGFGDLLHEIAAEHLEACRAARPDPATLGKQLFDFMLRDQWGLAALENYAPLLGDAGLKAYRASAEKLWRKVPTRGPGDDHARAYTDHFQITSIMETLARHEGDIDALVAIKSRDLTHPYHFLQIAEICAEAGRADAALEWAERGHAAFSDHDSRLVEFLAAEYGRRGRHDDAIALAWEEFERHPLLQSYQLLKTCADRSQQWAMWRDKALTLIRDILQKKARNDSLSSRDSSSLSPGDVQGRTKIAEGSTPGAIMRARVREGSHHMHPWIPAGHSLLVEIFLWEGDSDAALKEAREGSCTKDLWFGIAKAREADHPVDAAEIYREQLDAIVSAANNRAYDEAAQRLKKIRALMNRAGQAVAFAEYLAAVRTRHKAKRNFMQRIEKL